MVVTRRMVILPWRRRRWLVGRCQGCHCLGLSVCLLVLMMVWSVRRVSTAVHAAQFGIDVGQHRLHGCGLPLHCGDARVDAAFEFGYAVARRGAGRRRRLQLLRLLRLLLLQLPRLLRLLLLSGVAVRAVQCRRR